MQSTVPPLQPPDRLPLAVIAEADLHDAISEEEAAANQALRDAAAAAVAAGGGGGANADYGAKVHACGCGMRVVLCE